MKKLPRILLALAVSATASAAISAILGRVLFLSSRSEVVKLGVILFAVSFTVWTTLILVIRRKN